jgi:flagellar motor switch protein FliM
MSTAIVAPKPTQDEHTINLWKEVQYLTCQLKVELPVMSFTVRDLLQLAKGSVVDTHCKQVSNLPLVINEQDIALVEFELLGDRLAVRLMELL